jgi:DNA-binding NtrC family response regulator
VPPLRQRPEDILPLAEAFLGTAAAEADRPGMAIAAEATAALAAHDWPGNVRELRNRMERAALLAEGELLGVADIFPDRVRASVEPAITLAEARDVAERTHIRRVLSRCEGRVGDAARVLGISRTTLWERMRRLGLTPTEEG